jgi:hypothetical protein
MLLSFLITQAHLVGAREVMRNLTESEMLLSFLITQAHLVGAHEGDPGLAVGPPVGAHPQLDQLRQEREAPEEVWNGPARPEH